MGDEIQGEGFTQADFHTFGQRLRAETETLRGWLNSGRVAAGPPRIGAEVEGWLVDRCGRPAAVNTAVVDGCADARVVMELSRYNLELNVTARRLAERPFTALLGELEALTAGVEYQAERYGAGLVLAGILPSLRDEDLTLAQISPLARYRALNEQVLALRNRRQVAVQIEGRERLALHRQDVMLEAAATSLQVHLQLDPAKAHRLYNAASALSAATVAVAANAPALFDRLLWEETRIPLFEQAVEVSPPQEGGAGSAARVSFGSGYAREGLYQCFAENAERYAVLLPVCDEEAPEALPHLVLHNGTIWRWNRPIVGFGEDGQCHLRLEHRVMSAGPSLVDMVANTALVVGAMHGLAAREPPIETELPFYVAKRNFYAGARWGLAACIDWPGGRRSVRRLVLEVILPLAERGLGELGVADDERARFLGIVRARVRAGVTGSVWQRAWLQRHDRDWYGLVAAYRARQLSGAPVHRWAL